MEIEGMIIRDLGQLEGVSKAGNPWKKHEWVLETTGQFPRKVKFTVFGERTNSITFEVGKSYAVSVDIESREFNERWYTDVMAYGARPLDMPNVSGPVQGGYPQQVQGPQFTPQGPGAYEPPVSAGGSTFGGSSDFSQGDSQEDLPF